MTQDEMETELHRAYRAIRGLYTIITENKLQRQGPIGYHMLTIAAANRFVQTGKLSGGTESFVGKPPEEIHRWLE